MLDLLSEYYEGGSDNAPHEALGRAARKLGHGGALYLGGGIGIEKQTKPTGDVFRVAKGSGKAQEFPGPLSAVMHGFTLAGKSTATDTPGGATKVSDPAAAARLRELVDREAEVQKDIARYQRMLDRAKQRATTVPVAWSPAARPDDDLSWEQRRIDELGVELKQIGTERTKLLATGKVEEVEQARPGTNFTKIPPASVKKLSGIIDHYKSMAHPFTTCVRDQVKHGLSDDHAKRRCAVVKDLGAGTTKWRKGSKKVSEVAEAALLAAIERIGVVEEMLGDGMSVALVEGIPGATPRIAELAEGMSADYGLLALAGHPIGEAVFGVTEAFVAPAQRQALRSGGKAAPAQQRSPSTSKFDEAKHKRGAKGTSTGGKFVASGSSGEDVHAVQRKVGAQTDGQFGAKTKQAVMDFQRRHGLVADGMVGHQTAVALAGRYSSAKSAKPGALKSSDRAKLRAMRRKTTAGGRKGRPDRRRGGVTV